MNPNTSAGALPSFGSVTSTTPGFTFGTNTTSSGTGFSGFGTGTSATPSLSFGAATTAAQPTFGVGASSFGTGTSFAGLGAKPITTTAATGLTFGQTPTTVSAAGSNTSFGSLATPGFTAAPAPAATSAPTGFSFNFSASTPQAATTAASTSQPGLSLGSSLPATITLATTTTAVSGFSQPTTAPASTGFSLSFGTSTTSAAPTSTPSLGVVGTAAPAMTAATETSVAQPKSQVTFSQLDETIHKWTLELVELERVFLNQMDQVRDWDRLLLSTGDKIVSLNDSMQKVKLRQLQLNHELDFIVAQQRELEECLAPLEKEFANVTVSDPERNSVYQSAENLNTQLQQISEDLKGVIEHINEKNKSQDTNDPIVQVNRILNAHMNSLQWVDQNTAVIQQMLDQVCKMRDIYRRDSDATQNL